MILRIAGSPYYRAGSDAMQICLRASARALQITMTEADYYGPANHEAASNFFGQKKFSAKYSAASAGKL
jgi:hypothetical protein